MPFAHEKLDVYNLALDFLALADEVVKLISTDQHSVAKGMLERIAAMLVKLAKAQEDA